MGFLRAFGSFLSVTAAIFAVSLSTGSAARAETPANSREVFLLQLASDAMPDTYRLRVVVDKGSDEILGLAYGTKYVTRAEVNQGIILKRMSDRDVLGLKGNVSPRDGGAITMTFLRNGITGKKGTFKMLLTRIGSSFALLTDPGRVQFNGLYLKKNTVFGKTVGIDYVTPSMNGSNI